jgi:hypothetical protein
MTDNAIARRQFIRTGGGMTHLTGETDGDD